MKLSNGLKLYLAAPRPFWKWVIEYSEIDDIGLDGLVYIDNADLMGGESINPDIINMMEVMGLKSVTTVPVEHCYLSSGIVVETLEGFKFTYSGDCRPSKELALIGQNSDLLIHEATFKDDLKEEAMMKNHSTISEAIGVGKEMNAKNVLLTHFSQKYPVMPEIVMDQFKDDKMVVGIAFDMMKVKMCDFWKFRYIVPVLDKYLLKDGDI
jgi:ribonuclease Z